VGAYDAQYEQWRQSGGKVARKVHDLSSNCLPGSVSGLGIRIRDTEAADAAVFAPLPAGWKATVRTATDVPAHILYYYQNADGTFTKQRQRPRPQPQPTAVN